MCQPIAISEQKQQAAEPVRVCLGGHELAVPSEPIGWLRDCNEMLNDVNALRTRLDEDGYLLVRRLQKLERVLAARRMILEHLGRYGKLDRSAPFLDSVIAPGAGGMWLGGQKEVTHTDEFLDVVESREIMGFFDRLFGEKALTFDYKWLRVVDAGAATPSHYDNVFMGRGTRKLYTCWTPLGDIPLEAGPLTILVGSHLESAYGKVQETYGHADVDRDNINGHFSMDPLSIVKRYGGQWRTTEFRMGDALIFGMWMMHASLTNESNRFRISGDTRYQPASEPVDGRWIGREPIGNYAWRRTPPKPIEESRREWGV